MKEKSFSHKVRKTRRGFTLIELLVVMTIIAVLAGLALVSYQGARKTARDGKRKADLEQIRTALEMCYADTNGYPDTIYDDVSCNISSTETRTYLSGTPTDPATGDYYYYARTDTTTYELCAFLETTTTPPYPGSTSDCGPNGDYKVTNP